MISSFSYNVDGVLFKILVKLIYLRLKYHEHIRFCIYYKETEAVVIYNGIC